MNETTSEDLTKEVEALAKMALELQKVESVFQSCDDAANKLSATLETMRAVRMHLNPESIPKLNTELLLRVRRVKYQMRGAMVRSHETLTNLLALIPEPLIDTLSEELGLRHDDATGSEPSPDEAPAATPAPPGSNSVQ